MQAIDFLSGYLLRSELAAALRVSSRTIHNYEKLPDGLPSVLIGGIKYYRIEAVQIWLKNRERRPNLMTND